MAIQVLDGAAIEQLDASVKGEVLTPERDGYAPARELFNAMVDKRPAAIVRCSDPHDVMAAVELARMRAVDVSIRSGGHGVTGSAMNDGGIVIDLTPMKRITVDPVARTAKAQAGVTWGEFDAATQEHGLAVTGGRVSSTGIAGLTIGSGSGWLERKLGFTCDNLLEVDVVTSDGRFLRANDTENADLFWALKGGGGNFGVCTQFTYRLHPVGPVLYGGAVFHPGFVGRDLARAYREFIESAPDEVGGALAFLTAPPEEFIPEPARGKPVVATIAMYCGSVEDGEEALAPLKEMGQPVMDMLGPIPYTALQQIIDGGNQPGNRQYWKADFMDALPDEAIDVIVAAAAEVPSPLTALLLQPMGGASGRVALDATAFARRDMAWTYHLLSQWQSVADDDRNLEWTRRFAEAMKPYTSGGVYINYTSDAGDERVADAYRGHLDRLVEVKDRYDPLNMFRASQNIRPSAEAAARAERPS